MRAQRLVIDLKTGGAYPEHVEDNRAYALLHTLRFGVPPYRVASFFLEGGTWQAEDVQEELLFHAADRVIATARAASSLRAGREPVLTARPVVQLVPARRRVPGRRPRRSLTSDHDAVEHDAARAQKRVWILTRVVGEHDEIGGRALLDPGQAQPGTGRPRARRERRSAG